MRSLYKLSKKAFLARLTSWQDLCNRSLFNVSGQGLQTRCPGKISVQELYKRSLGKISVRGLLARSQQISVQCLCTRSLYEISSRRVLLARFCKRPLGKISATDLYAMSRYKISKIGVLARSVRKILSEVSRPDSWKDLSRRDLHIRTL